MMRSVGIGEICVGRPPLRLTAYGVGSCLGVTLYERTTFLGGMVHCLLPDEGLSRDSDGCKGVQQGLSRLMRELLSAGASRAKLEAKMAGGADICPSLLPNGRPSIGGRNIETARLWLKKHGIPLVAEDVAGDYGRNLLFDLGTGTLEVQRVDCRNSRQQL